MSGEWRAEMEAASAAHLAARRVREQADHDTAVIAGLYLGDLDGGHSEMAEVRLRHLREAVAARSAAQAALDGALEHWAAVSARRPVEAVAS